MSKLSSTNIPKISVKMSCFTNAVSFIFFYFFVITLLVYILILFHGYLYILISLQFC